MQQPYVAQLHLAKNDSLVTAGSPFTGVFALRSGSAKTLATAHNGATQIVRIDMCGDVLGLDGFAAGIHTSTVVALEDSVFCFVPRHRLVQLTKRRPALPEKLLRAMAHTLVHQQRAVFALAGTNALQRIAYFLLATSERLAARGFPASYLALNLTRNEIGSLLGLRPETVSRCISSLEDGRFIQVIGRHIELLDTAGLENLAARVA
jgi:CRP/FNR family transcriptional regulator